MNIDKDYLSKLILEVMSEEEQFTDGGDISNQNSNNRTNYRDLGSAIFNLSKDFSPVTLNSLNGEVDLILKNGKGQLNLNYGKAVDKKITVDFDYIVSVLAALYQKDADNLVYNKGNIVQYLFYAFYPVPIRSTINSIDTSIGRERLNQFGHAVATRAKVYKDLTFSNRNDVVYFIDAIKDCVRDALMYTLSKYNPEIGTYSKLMMFKSAQNLIDEMRDKNKFLDLRSSSGSKEYLDDPMGHDETDIKSSKLASDNQDVDDVLSKKNSNLSPFKSKEDAIDTFIRKVLTKNKQEKMLNVYKLEQDGMSQKEISDSLNLSNENVRQIKWRLQNYIDQNFVENGKMKKFLEMYGYSGDIPRPFNLSNKAPSWEAKPSSDSSHISPEDAWSNIEYSAPSRLRESIVSIVRSIIAEIS
jgi:hypothetical protein